MDAMSSSNTSSSATKRMSDLSAEELSRMERNRQKALLLRQQKQQNLTSHELYSLESKVGAHSATAGCHDSGGGFLIDSDDEDIQRNHKTPTNGQTSATNGGDDPQQPFVCRDCGQEFGKSFLWSHFRENTCDSCRDPKGRHSLITRTEAKSEYLLKDCDLDRREPSLAFILRPNPREFARHDMRLYLRSQVEDRALQVWGTEEAIEEERDRRSTATKRRREKQYDKRLKSLRMTVRSSVYTRPTAADHCHDFTDESYNELEDSGCDIYESGLEVILKQCKHLKSLNISNNCEIKGRCLVWVNASIERLDLRDCWRLESKELIAMTRLRLEALTELLVNSGINDETIAEICDNCPNIRHLNISFECLAYSDHCGRRVLSDSGFCEMAKLDKLEILTLRHVGKLTDTSLQCILKGCKNISQLTLNLRHRHQLTDDAFTDIAILCPNLQYLESVHNHFIGKHSLNSICKMDSVVALVLRGN
ncbi:unnamed protein product, partial [Medioppia subpectinata]